MKKLISVIVLIISLAITTCTTTTENSSNNSSSSHDNDNDNTVVTNLIAQWGKSTPEGDDYSNYADVALDSSGNIYIAGRLKANSTFKFSDTVSATTVLENYNPVLVKYDSNGDAQWAKTLSSVSTGGNSAEYLTVAVDSHDNIYVGGYIFGDEGTTYNFGNSITKSTSTDYSNLILVKYNSDGDAQWAKGVTSSDSFIFSQINDLAVDDSDNIYAVGYIDGDTSYSFNFGNNVKLAPCSDYQGPVLVKYTSDGVAQWAKTTSQQEGNDAEFNSITLDSSGNIYTAGYMCGTNTYGFSGSSTITAQGNSEDENLILVKYNSSGDAQWARTTTAGSEKSFYYGVAVDESKNVYAVGYVYTSEKFGFGNDITVTGSSLYYQNPVLVKYNSDGDAQWAKTITEGTGGASYHAVCLDSSGNIYIAGQAYGSYTYNFGNEVTASSQYISNTLAVVYDKNGTARCATVGITSFSKFESIILGSSGTTYAVGIISGPINPACDFGNDITVSGNCYYQNAVLVKYIAK